jgi:hypothetical protein
VTVSLAEATAVARRIQRHNRVLHSGIGEPKFEKDARLLAGFVLAGDTSLEAGSDSPWPVREVLGVLADAANHLLREHDCDCLGWETIEAARQAAVELQARPLAGDTERLRTALGNVADGIEEYTGPVRQLAKIARAALAENES